MNSTREIERMQRKLSTAMGARPRDVGAAIEALEEAIALARSNPQVAEWFVLSELLGYLADEYEAAGRTDDALEAMRQAIAAGWAGEPDGRCRLAEILMHAGRMGEAAQLWADVRADTPADIWLYNNAGIAYCAAGEHRVALAWLDEAVRLALRTDDPEHLLDQLLDYRGESLAALGRDEDELQREGARVLASSRPRRARSRALYQGTGPVATVVAGPRRAAMAWFPAGEYEQARQMFPEIVAGHDHETYCLAIQERLRQAARSGVSALAVAPLRLETYLRWCADRGEDPARSRSAYAAQLPPEALIAWPPGRNDPCWCGSGRRYKRCCARMEDDL